jgi:protein gp37
MKDSKIQWCDSTVNPTSGCDGCELWTKGLGGPCYAGNFHEVRLAKSLPTLYAPTFDEVRMIPGRMAKAVRCMSLEGRDRDDKPWLNGLRRKYFVGDLGDIFSAAVTFQFLKEEVIDVATSPHGRRHDLLLLTKQPNRAAKFAAWLTEQGVAWPDNVWLGTSVTGRASLPRIAHLRSVPAPVLFLSVEPLVNDPGLDAGWVRGIRWIIVGGESDQGANPARPFDLKWARDVIALGRSQNAAVFVKQLGSRPVDAGAPLKLKDGHGGEWDEWPQDVRVRQMPFGCG